MYAKYHMKHSNHGDRMKEQMSATAEQSDEDYIFVNNIFAGTEKVIFSKDFKGGEIKNTFGGCEINLMQAEIKEEEAVMIINQQFGGVKLIVPANWIVKSDINCVFAGLEDQRKVMDAAHHGNTKNLILRGSLFMSGLEIVSY